MKPFQLRLPDGLHERLKREAALNLRSLNGEILFRLERSVDLVEPWSGVELARIVERHGDAA